MYRNYVSYPVANVVSRVYRTFVSARVSLIVSYCVSCRIVVTYLEPYRILYRKCIVTSWNYDTDPGPTYVSTSYHCCILAYRKFTCIGIEIRQNTDTPDTPQIHPDTPRYGYGEKVPRYMGKSQLSPTKHTQNRTQAYTSCPDHGVSFCVSARAITH